MIYLILSITAGFANHGASLKFNDGADNQYVVVNDNASINFTDSMSVEVWVKVNEMPTKTDNVVLIKPENADTIEYIINAWWSGAAEIDVLKFTWETAKSTWYVAETETTNLKIELGQWYYICGTYDKHYMRIYVDGVIKDSTACSIDLPQNDSILSIGNIRNYESTYNLKGYVKNIRLYSRVLRQKEILWNMRNPSHPYNTDGLKLWLKMNEFTGDTCYDYSGYGNNGVIVNTPKWGVETMQTGGKQ